MEVTCSTMGAYGRLGNQMFQIAAVLGYAAKYNAKPVFPEWEYNKYFKNPIQTNGKGPVFPFKTVPGFIDYFEPQFYYIPIPNYNQNINIFGYFQSEKYWEGSEELIKKTFELKSDIQIFIIDYYIDSLKKAFKINKTCSIHVRRGDYITTHKDSYEELTTEYYYQAARYLYGEKEDQVLFIICSDDPDWCRNNLKFKNQIIVPNQLDIYHLFTMAGCDDNIIANSSFSVWAAILNRNPNKKVIAPLKWFKMPLDTKDLYCKNWVKI